MLARTPFADEQDRHGTVRQLPDHGFHRPHAWAYRLEKWGIWKASFSGVGHTRIRFVGTLFHEIKSARGQGSTDRGVMNFLPEHGLCQTGHGTSAQIRGSP